MEGAYDLRERTFRFAQRIVEIAERLTNKPSAFIFREQLLRAGTSIGANLEEADGVLTKKDFVNKLVVARKEAKETRYWLRLIQGRYIPSQDVQSDLRECQELINIFSSIINKCR